MKELISVIVPVYKVEKYLDRCVESIVNQTYKNLEIILVDDGSPDNCGHMCDVWAEKDSRIRVIHKENGGLSDARNKGLDLAIGKYITFVDSDDYVSEDYVEYLYYMIKENNADISIVKFMVTTSANENKRTSKATIECFNKIDALKEMFYARLFSTSAWAKLYRKELFSEIRFPYGKFSEDLFTTYKLINLSDKIVYSSQICYYYLHRPESITTAKFTQKSYDVFEALNQIEKDIPIKEYGLIKPYAAQMFSALMTAMSMKPSISDIKKLKKLEFIKKYRKKVVFNRMVRSRVRMCAFLTYFGMEFEVFIINLYYKIKWSRV